MFRQPRSCELSEESSTLQCAHHQVRMHSESGHIVISVVSEHGPKVDMVYTAYTFLLLGLVHWTREQLILIAGF